MVVANFNFSKSKENPFTFLERSAAPSFAVTTNGRIADNSDRILYVTRISTLRWWVFKWVGGIQFLAGPNSASNEILIFFIWESKFLLRTAVYVPVMYCLILSRSIQSVRPSLYTTVQIIIHPPKLARPFHRPSIYLPNPFD